MLHHHHCRWLKAEDEMDHFKSRPPCLSLRSGKRNTWTGFVASCVHANGGQARLADQPAGGRACVGRMAEDDPSSHWPTHCREGKEQGVWPSETWRNAYCSSTNQGVAFFSLVIQWPALKLRRLFFFCFCIWFVGYKCTIFVMLGLKKLTPP